MNPSSCPYGYTDAELRVVLGDRYEKFLEWNYGSTMLFCEGREYDHEKKEYVPSSCARNPHGVVTFFVDVSRFLHNLPQDD